MNIKLVTIDSEKDSAKRLGFETFTNLNDSFENLNKNTVWIRWGFSSKFYDKNSRKRDFDFVINPALSIYNNCLKDQSLTTISQVALTPKIYKSGDSIPKGEKVVYRYTSHDSGKNFRTMIGPFVCENGMYAKTFIDSKKEWRVWFAGNNTMGAIRWKQKPELSDVCRSLWAYDYLKVPKELHDIVMKIKKVQNLDLGGVDLLETKDKRYIILENNTSCTVDSKYICAFYKKSIDTLIKEKFGHLF